MNFISVYRDLLVKGEESSPRGLLIKELENYQFNLYPYQRFTSYRARKFNLDYAKFEMMWYLTGDRWNESITRSASMWSELRQPQGFWFSNYGYYWFHPGYINGSQSGFDWALECLKVDPDSRQAVIPMLSTDHLFVGNKDIVCTYSVGFRIRKNRLNMSVNMRSQDAMWGMTNDIFCFSVLHEMLFVALRDLAYPDLQIGVYTHKVDSLHVYEKHFDMLENLVAEGVDGHYEIDCPRIHNFREVVNLMHYMEEDHRDEHRFTVWLTDNKYAVGSK